MAQLLVRRVSLAVLQVFLVLTLIFALIHLLPGDPVLMILGAEQSPDPAVVAAVREKLGLNRPLLTQYVTWIKGIAQLDLGSSLMDGSPVWQTAIERLPRTLELVLAAVAVATILGIPLGVLAALHRNRLADWVVSTLAAMGISTPVYVMGSLAVLIFAVKLRWLPTAGYVAFAEDPGAHVLRMVLPTAVLALGLIATITRTTRSSVLEVLHQDYVRTARAKGVRPQGVIMRHVLRTALIPIVTVIGLQLGTLIGSSVLVEFIFNWPGISTLLVTAIGRRDYPMVQGVILLTSSLFILINMVVDVIYGYLDPRIHYS
ncbi:MAG: ABC transporter permease [Bacillota bacterium]